MQTIICKKCGATIDASLRECPVCGAVNAAAGIPAEQHIAQDIPVAPQTPASSPREQEYGVRQDQGFGTPDLGQRPEYQSRPAQYGQGIDRNAGQQDYARRQEPSVSEPSVHDMNTLENLGSDDIFNTTVWKTDNGANGPDPDATRPFRSTASPEERAYRPAAPTPTRAQQRPVQQRAAVQQRPVQQRPRTQPKQEIKYAPAKKDDEENGGRKKLVIWAIALLALLTLVLTIMSGAFNFTDKSGTTKMPNVVGQTETEATKALEDLGLKVETTSEDSNTAKGTVIRQSIKEGKKVTSGETVTLTISTGSASTTTDNAEEVRVPDLRGQTYEQALKQIEAAGLLMTTATEQYDADTPAGEVISQTPASNSKLKKGEVVTVVISKGPEPTPSVSSFSITALAGTGGSISPKGASTVKSGSSQTYTITPQSGFSIKEVKVDGTSVGAVGSYTFSNVTTGHTIYAVFEKTTTPETTADVN